MNLYANFRFIRRVLLRVLPTLVLLSLATGPKFNPTHSFAAPSEPLRLFFSSQNISIPPNAVTSLMIDAKSYEVGFVQIELSFDHSVINLTGEILTASLLKTVISKTSKDQANTTGRILIAIALAPGDLPSTGLYELAQIPIGPNTSNSNRQTSISFVDEGIQIVDLTTTVLSTTSESGFITVNPTYDRTLFLPLIKR